MVPFVGTRDWEELVTDQVIIGDLGGMKMEEEGTDKEFGGAEVMLGFFGGVKKGWNWG